MSKSQRDKGQRDDAPIEAKGKIMGIYYFLLNDTKRECVHLDHHIKRGPMTQNTAVHFALLNYMMANLGDELRLCDDTRCEGDGYTEVNLLAYKFDDPEVIVKIIELLNEVYGSKRYVLMDGAGVRAMCPDAYSGGD